MMPEAEEHDRDAPFRSDVARLDALLEEVLSEEEGESLCRRLREIPIAPDGADAAPAGFEPETVGTLVRACGFYSQLFNIAEDLHATRLARAGRRAGAAPGRGSVERVLIRLRQDGVGLDRLKSAFAGFEVAPVLTAHPTEVQRQSVLDAQRAVRRALSHLQRADLTRDEEAELSDRLKRVLLRLWQTSEIRHFKLTVRDEIENGVAYHGLTFFTALPRLYQQLERRIEAVYGEKVALPSFLRVGSWI
ncbi:phosphoenolpyruvate carboxylase, partial [Crenobacter luteus]|uniref:phosphoenolpyruvate carboxylase n=1 Tax=Crenobacter luteus TaxID=1452487 RepID=UPI000AFE17FD